MHLCMLFINALMMIYCFTIKLDLDELSLYIKVKVFSAHTKNYYIVEYIRSSF